MILADHDRLAKHLLLSACIAGCATAPHAAPHAAPAATIDYALVAKLCASATCSGPMSVITVYRTTSGEPVVYAHQGDLDACSHPPLGYFDRNGELLLGQGEHPVESDEEAARLAGERRDVLAGLREGEQLSCGTAVPAAGPQGVGDAGKILPVAREPVGTRRGPAQP